MRISKKGRTEIYYFTAIELRALLQVAYDRNRLHHLALLTSLCHALRISELLALSPDDLHEHTVFIRGQKDGLKQLQALHKSGDPLFDETVLAVHAHGVHQAGEKKLFPLCRQRYDQLIRQYCKEANINPRKAHWHTLRHSTAMLVWSESHSLGQIKQALRHRSFSSSLIYLSESDNLSAVISRDKALAAMTGGTR